MKAVHLIVIAVFFFSAPAPGVGFNTTHVGQKKPAAPARPPKAPAVPKPDARTGGTRKPGTTQEAALNLMNKKIQKIQNAWDEISPKWDPDRAFDLKLNFVKSPKVVSSHCESSPKMKAIQSFQGQLVPQADMVYPAKVIIQHNSDEIHGLVETGSLHFTGKFESQDKTDGPQSKHYLDFQGALKNTADLTASAAKEYPFSSAHLTIYVGVQGNKATAGKPVCIVTQTYSDGTVNLTPPAQAASSSTPTTTSETTAAPTAGTGTSDPLTQPAKPDELPPEKPRKSGCAADGAGAFWVLLLAAPFLYRNRVLSSRTRF